MRRLNLYDVLFVSLYNAYTPTSKPKSNINSVLKKYASLERCKHIKSDIKKVLQNIKRQGKNPIREVESVMITLNLQASSSLQGDVADTDKYWCLVRELDLVGAPTFAQEQADFDRSIESCRPLVMHIRKNEIIHAFDDDDRLQAPLNFVYYADNILPVLSVLRNNEHFVSKIQSSNGRHNITISTKEYPIANPQVCINAYELQSAKAKFAMLYKIIAEQGYSLAYIDERDLEDNHAYVNRTHETFHFDHNGDQVEPIDIMIVGTSIQKLKYLAETVASKMLFQSFYKIFKDVDQTTMLLRINPAYYLGYEAQLPEHCKL